MVEHSPAPETGPAPRPRRRFLRLAGALVAVCCSLSLVIGTAPPAQAFAPAPIIIGTELAVPAVVGTGGSSLAVGGAAVTIGAVGIGLLGLGLVAYATRDTWMPVAADLFNKASTLFGADPENPCTASPTTASIVQNLGSGMQPAAILAVTLTTSGCSYPWYDWGAVQIERNGSRCIGSGQGTVPRGEVYSTGYDAGNGAVQIWSEKGATVPGELGGQITANCGLDYALDVTFRLSVRYLFLSVQHVVRAVLPDDLYKMTTRVECTRPDGSTFEITDSESGHPDRLSVPSCRAVDPTSVPTHVWGTSFGDDVIDYGLPTPETWETKFPDCFGPTGLLCTIKVYVDGLPCVPGLNGCAYWWPNRNKPEWASRIECRFGAYDVPLANCEPLKRSYRPDAPPEGDPWTDPSGPPEPDPDPGGDPDPDPDPDPSGSPDPDPDPTGQPSPGPSGFPTTGPNPPGPGPNPDPGTDPNTRNCFGAAWSLNPVDWVYVPVKCAFIWAFVPKTSVSVRATRIGNLISGRVPFSWFAPVFTLPGQLPSKACPDWRMKVRGVDSFQFDKNVVCESSFTAALVGSRDFITAGMLALAFTPLLRGLAYASIPLLKPTPTDGK